MTETPDWTESLQGVKPENEIAVRGSNGIKEKGNHRRKQTMENGMERSGDLQVTD